MVPCLGTNNVVPHEDLVDRMSWKHLELNINIDPTPPNRHIITTIIMPWFEKFPTPLQGFTHSERRDMLLYIIGVMLFKFGSEAFIGSVVGYATKRFDAGGGGGTFERIGILQGLNLGMRCLGSILVGPLLRKFASRDVLCCATIALALSISMLLAVDAIMGGRFKTRTDDERSTFDYYGDSNPNFMFPFFAICGLSNGIIDLVRSIIPRDIVGGNVKKLQTLDSMVSKSPFSPILLLFLSLTSLAWPRSTSSSPLQPLLARLPPVSSLYPSSATIAHSSSPQFASQWPPSYSSICQTRGSGSSNAMTTGGAQRISRPWWLLAVLSGCSGRASPSGPGSCLALATSSGLFLVTASDRMLIDTLIPALSL